MKFFSSFFSNKFNFFSSSFWCAIAANLAIIERKAKNDLRRVFLLPELQDKKSRLLALLKESPSKVQRAYHYKPRADDPEDGQKNSQPRTRRQTRSVDERWRLIVFYSFKLNKNWKLKKEIVLIENFSTISILLTIILFISSCPSRCQHLETEKNRVKSENFKKVWRDVQRASFHFRPTRQSQNGHRWIFLRPQQRERWENLLAVLEKTYHGMHG